MKYKQLKKALFQGNKINFAVAIFTMMLLCAANILTAFIFKGLSDIAIDGTMEELKRFVLATLLFIVIYVPFPCGKQSQSTDLIIKLQHSIKRHCLIRLFIRISMRLTMTSQVNIFL